MDAVDIATISPAEKPIDWRALRAPAIWAGALGYLVDIFDLNAGSNFRQDLFRSFGVPDDQSVQMVVELSNWSRWGLLIGGFLWGILGDRLGRLFSLFGSIALYSVSILGVALFCHSIASYKIGTFLINLGLAGELGGSVTLVLESLPTTMRTFGVMLVAAMGMVGVVIAGLLAEICTWQVGFGIGGVMGLALLAFRVQVRESILFQQLKPGGANRGNWFALLWPWRSLERYLACILVGAPPLFVLFFYNGLAPEIGKDLHLMGDLKVNRAGIAAFSGLAVGDLLVSWLSYKIKSRKRPILWFMGGSAVLQTLIAFSYGASSLYVYVLFFLLGMVTANALYVTAVAEQFGTNLRDTATTTVTNFIRFTILPLNLFLTAWKAPLGLTHAGFLISLGTLALGILALSRLKETYGTNLDFVEP